MSESTTIGATGTISFDTISTSGTYILTAEGAEGGASSFAGGEGGIVIGTFYLTAGTTLEIVVGEAGAAGNSGGNGAGGGGGSFIYDENTAILLEAAGGGGGGGTNYTGVNASSTTSGTNSHGNNNNISGGGGNNGGAAGAGGDQSGGNGGGGGGGGVSFAGNSSNANNNFENGGGGGGGDLTNGTFATAGVPVTLPTTPGAGGSGHTGGTGGYGGGGGGGGSFLATSATNATNNPSNNFALNTAPNGEAIISMACFAAGTRILTPRGEIPVEKLHEGDLVITTDGNDVPIKWIGHRTVDLLRYPHPEKAQPIRISANAIADGTPARDLYLSPDHALYFENHLIPAKDLLNNRNVTQSQKAKITYYHIELATHAAIFAEHTPCETYLETGNRSCFENAPVTSLECFSFDLNRFGIPARLKI